MISYSTTATKVLHLGMVTLISVSFVMLELSGTKKYSTRSYGGVQHQGPRHTDGRAFKWQHHPGTEVTRVLRHGWPWKPFRASSTLSHVNAFPTVSVCSGLHHKIP